MPAFADLKQRFSLAELLFIGFVAIYPLFINPFFAPVFGLPKLVLLYIVSIILAAVWLVKAIKAGRFVIAVPKIALPVATFLLVALLSSVQSVHPLSSFVGQYGRWEGLTTLACYTIVFAAAYSLASRKGALRPLFIGALASAALVSAIATIEHFWGNPALLVARIYCSAGFGQPNAFEVGRSIATFGSATLLAAYLAMILPLVLAAILANGRPILPKTVLYSIFALGLAALLLTFARAAWLGAIFGLILVFLLSGKGAKFWRQLTLLGLIFVLVAVSIQFLGGPYMPLSRAASLFELEGSSLTRIQMWQASLPLIAENPALGSGPDTFKFVFGKYKPEGWVQHITDPLIDRAHNDSLQTMVTFGVLGLAFYLWIFVILFWIGIKAVRGQQDLQLKWILGGTLGGALAYLIHLQFNFSHFSVSPHFWLFIGIASALSNSPTKKEAILLLTNRQKSISYILIGSLAAALIGAATLVLTADSYFYKGRDLEAKGKLDEALFNYQRATALNRLENTYRLTLAQSYFELAQNASPKQRQDLLKSGIEAFEESKRLNPIDEQIYFRTGSAYLAAGRLGRAELLSAAINEHRQGLALNPVMVDAYVDIGVAYALLNDYDNAIVAWADALQIDPGNDRVYFNLGWVYEQKRDFSRAKAAYQKAYRLNPKMQEAKAGYDRL